MTAIVADASALVDYLLQIGGAEAVGSTLRSSDSDVHTPSLCDAEVMSGLFRGLRQGVSPEASVRVAVADYQDFPLTRHDHLPYLWRVWELRNNFSARDAFYVALSEQLGATLVTTDLRLATAARAVLGVAVISP